MSLVLWSILGLAAGYLAHYMLKENNPNHMIIDISLGIVGALVGGVIMNMYGEINPDSFNLYGVIVSILGAILIIGLGRTVQKPRYS